MDTLKHALLQWLHEGFFEVADNVRETFFGENDMKAKQSVVVVGDDALFACLQERDVPLEILDSPRRVDYPL